MKGRREINIGRERLGKAEFNQPNSGGTNTLVIRVYDSRLGAIQRGNFGLENMLKEGDVFTSFLSLFYGPSYNIKRRIRFCKIGYKNIKQFVKKEIEILFLFFKILFTRKLIKFKFKYFNYFLVNKTHMSILCDTLCNLLFKLKMSTNYNNFKQKSLTTTKNKDCGQECFRKIFSIDSHLNFSFFSKCTWNL